MLFMILFALLTPLNISLTDAQQTPCGEIITITSGPKLGRHVSWTVPLSEANSYFSFDVELWSMQHGPGHLTTQRRVATLGQTHTGSIGHYGRHYQINITTPDPPPQQRTTYFVAVYGRKYPDGPAMTQIHPWDPIYYGIQDVYLTHQ
jgi:hypothetical protein